MGTCWASFTINPPHGMCLSKMPRYLSDPINSGRLWAGIWPSKTHCGFGRGLGPSDSRLGRLVLRCAFPVLRIPGFAHSWRPLAACLLTFILHLDYQRSSDPSLLWLLLLLCLDDSQQTGSRLTRCVFESLFRASPLDVPGPHFRCLIS